MFQGLVFVLRNKVAVKIMPVLFTFLFSSSYEITAGNYPFSAVISSSMNLEIHVKTNVNSFICNYKSDINDTISYLFSSKDNKYFLGENRYFVPVTLIDCHNSNMKNDMQEMFNSSKYPNIVIKIKDIHYDRNSPEKGRIYLSLTIDGIEKCYFVTFETSNNNNCLKVSGNLPVNLNDFNIVPPSKFFGLVKVSKMIDISFLLNLKLVESGNNVKYFSIK